MDNLDSHYDVELDLYNIDENTMTDAGVRVGELEPIGDCSLTPGDPSPVGRTSEGDLAYPVHQTKGSIELSRRTAAELAHLYAKAHGITEVPSYPLKKPEHHTFFELFNAAVPEVLFNESNHGQVAYKGALQAVLDGNWSNYPQMLLTDLERELKGERPMPPYKSSLP